MTGMRVPVHLAWGGMLPMYNLDAINMLSMVVSA
jgi:hypothetical protein